MQPRTLQIENFGTSQPKMPFIAAMQEAPEDYVIKKVTLSCNKQEVLKCHTEIGYEPDKMEKRPFTPGVEINHNVKKGQLARIVIQASVFVPEGVKGNATVEIA